jgi:hypothetical protein
MKPPVGFANFCGRAFLVLCLFVVGVPSAFAFDDPPFRVARLNFVEGEVSFQPGGETDWAWATLNRPMTAGDSLWTGDRSRAEMHIGSTAIRVDGQTSVSFLNLDDRTVQIQLNSGTVDVRVRNLSATTCSSLLARKISIKMAHGERIVISVRCGFPRTSRANGHPTEKVIGPGWTRGGGRGLTTSL